MNTEKSHEGLWRDCLSVEGRCSRIPAIAGMTLNVTSGPKLCLPPEPRVRFQGRPPALDLGERKKGRV
jgi:hypothetical protein